MPTSTDFWRHVLFTLLLCVGCVGTFAQTLPATLPMGDYQLAPRRLAENVYVVEGANADFSPANGCNIINTGFIVAGEGVIVINTGPSRLYGEQLRAAIARITPKPIASVLNLNLHPDYFLGNQAFVPAPLLATAVTRAGMAREAAAYEANLFRLCGDWMKATESALPTSTTPTLPLGAVTLAGRKLVLREYQGHTASDVVVFDVASGVVFAGGVAFADRIPTTPHAVLPAWQASLTALERDIPEILGSATGVTGLTWLVPSHGPVRNNATAIAQTRSYLTWLDTLLTKAANRGVEMTDLLKTHLPVPFNTWAAVDTEFARNVVKLYPGYEVRALGR